LLTISGLERAKAQGRIGGRPKTEDNVKVLKALHSLRKQGKSIRQIAAELGISPGTVEKLVKQKAA
jgi:DNA-binding NarL/FixJ family response regulator